MLKDAQRPAFATTFETAGGVADYLIQQWQAKRLTLMPMAGTTSAEQDQCFVRFLDRLAERVILRAPRLFLAPDTEVPPQLNHLRHLLAGEVGEELVAALTSGQLVAAAVPHLASVHQFLAQHGWRPKRYFLCHLWELLAQYQTDSREERRLLIEALGSAERFEDVQRIHRRLDAIDHARAPTDTAGGA